MQLVPALPLVYEFSRHPPPRATIRPGETLRVESEDALSGQIRRPGDRRDRRTMPYSNPIAGPVFVEGAEPGDQLAVTIHAIEPRDGQCATYIGPPRQVGEWLGAEPPHGAHVCPIENGRVMWSDQIALPYQPMLGCVGTAPAWGVPTTLPPGPHGGNLDIIEVRPGATVYLPVTVPGGYLYLGDAHASMGHGELSATALEMAALTTISVRVVKGCPLIGVRVESDDFLLAVATHNTHERSIAEAYSRLILWMEHEHGWNRWKAYDLLTQIGQLSIGHYITGAVGAKIDKRYLKPAA